MFNKTTSFLFNKYGEIINELNPKQASRFNHSTIRIRERSFSTFYCYDCEVYIKVLSGIVMLIITDEPEGKTYEQFVIHRHIRIKKGMKFNFITISNQSKIELETEIRCKPTIHPTFDQSPIIYEPIVPSFEVKEIYLFHCL